MKLSNWLYSKTILKISQLAGFRDPSVGSLSPCFIRAGDGCGFLSFPSPPDIMLGVAEW